MTGMGVGMDAPRIGSPIKAGMGAPRMGMYQPLPFIGTWDQKGAGKKKLSRKGSKKGSRNIARKRFTVQERPSLEYLIAKPKFHDNIPLSNYDLLEWCKYLKIPITTILSRDESLPHNHKQALFIYNLEPSYMNGSHWVATYVKNKIVNYFDSFGMPPLQEVVTHARKNNLTLLHQNNQIQNIYTTTCGYFCLTEILTFH